MSELLGEALEKYRQYIDQLRRAASNKMIEDCYQVMGCRDLTAMTKCFQVMAANGWERTEKLEDETQIGEPGRWAYVVDPQFTDPKTFSLKLTIRWYKKYTARNTFGPNAVQVIEKSWADFLTEFEKVWTLVKEAKRIKDGRQG